MNYEWYNPDKHKNILMELFMNVSVTGYEIDRDMAIMNDGYAMYHIYTYDIIINITQNDYIKVCNEFENYINNFNRRL